MNLDSFNQLFYIVAVGSILVGLFVVPKFFDRSL